MIILGIALLLSVGLVAAKICQRLRLPSITGYILAGLVLGPSGVGFITEDSIGHSLDHFTQIALMMIAFGIGEHIELKKLKKHTKSLLWIGFCETFGTFFAVSIAIYGTIYFTDFQVAGWGTRDYLALSILLGAVGVATAPAATLLVTRELKAKGPLTSTLMAIVAIDDGLAIMIFGLAVTITHQLIGGTGDSLLLSVLAGFLEIGASLLLGVLTAVCQIYVLRNLRESGEIMTAGLAILLFCSALATYLNLSPLLAGMTAGFILINKVERDVRIFRALNRFEPPVYLLFFTLAGTHLDIRSLGAAGIIGVIYFLARIGGKIIGVAVGARIAKSPPVVQKYLGFALLPQAGVAIGLIFLLSSDPALATYEKIITPVVLAGVFLSELIGPVSAKFALTRANETGAMSPAGNGSKKMLAISNRGDFDENGHQDVRVVPWVWGKITPPKNPSGIVAFNALHRSTVQGLARMATIFANYYGAQLMAVRVRPPGGTLPKTLFAEEQKEINSLGYSMETELVPDHIPVSGLVAAIEYNKARAVVLGYPLNDSTGDYQAQLEIVAGNIQCQMIVVRFHEELHTERILVPLIDLDNLADLYEVLAALNKIGEHQIRLLYLASSTAAAKDLVAKENEIIDWLKKQSVKLTPQIRVVRTESRVETILDAAVGADVVVMDAPHPNDGMTRFLFGSLADSVAKKIQTTLIVAYNAGKHI